MEVFVLGCVMYYLSVGLRMRVGRMKTMFNQCTLLVLRSRDETFTTTRKEGHNMTVTVKQHHR